MRGSVTIKLKAAVTRTFVISEKKKKERKYMPQNLIKPGDFIYEEFSGKKLQCCHLGQVEKNYSNLEINYKLLPSARHLEN